MRVVPNSKPAYMWVKPTTAAAAAPIYSKILKFDAGWTQGCQLQDAHR